MSRRTTKLKAASPRTFEAGARVLHPKYGPGTCLAYSRAADHMIVHYHVAGDVRLYGSARKAGIILLSSARATHRMARWSARHPRVYATAHAAPGRGGVPALVAAWRRLRDAAPVHDPYPLTPEMEALIRDPGSAPAPDGVWDDGGLMADGLLMDTESPIAREGLRIGLEGADLNRYVAKRTLEAFRG